MAGEEKGKLRKCDGSGEVKWRILMMLAMCTG